MKAITMHLSEISESREMMEARPYPIVIYFTYLVMGILCAALIWMYFGEIDLVVKGNGITRTDKAMSIVSNKVTGRVTESHLAEGLQVHKGDILYVIAHDELTVTENLLVKEKGLIETNLQNLAKYKVCIESGKNLFDRNNVLENSFYSKYNGFSANLFTANESIKKLQQDIKGMNQLKASLQTGFSQFSNNSDPYALKYEEYTLKLQELDASCKESERQYAVQKELYDAGVIAKENFIAAEVANKKEQLAKTQYIISFQKALENEISDALHQIKMLGVSNTHVGSNNQLPLVTQAIIETDEAIRQGEERLRTIMEKLEQTRLEAEKCYIRAEIDGVMNIKQKIAVGDYINAGTTVASVIPVTSKTYTMQITMPEKEIASVKIGDQIKYHFHALPYQEYGELTGRVISISTDSVPDEKLGTNYFIVEASVDNKPLTSYKGKQASLKVGMTCEAQIITRSKRILSILVEKMDLWD